MLCAAASSAANKTYWTICDVRVTILIISSAAKQQSPDATITRK
jgi:hypothetical protein